MGTAVPNQMCLLYWYVYVADDCALRELDSEGGCLEMAVVVVRVEEGRSTLGHISARCSVVTLASV